MILTNTNTTRRNSIFKKYFLIFAILIIPGQTKEKTKKESFKYYVTTKSAGRMNANETIVYNKLKSKGFTDAAAAAVMGVVGGESNFKTLKEASYKNTSNSRIRAIFPSRLGSMSDSQLNSLKSNYNDFFNAVYGGMYGNTSPGDGSKYVGRGFNGITFKSNYQALKNGTGTDFITNPELLEQPKHAAEALAYYFRNEKNINNFETAFKEAYRRNAGYGNSWEYYDKSSNPAHEQGTKLKREKGLYYLNEFGSKKKIIIILLIIAGVLAAIYYKDKILKLLK